MTQSYKDFLRKKFPKVASELPPWEWHSRLHTQIFARHAKDDARRGVATGIDPASGQPVIDPKEEKHVHDLAESFKGKILKAMRTKRYTARGSKVYRDWLVEDLFRVVSWRGAKGAKRPYWTTEAAIYLAMMSLAKAGLVQYRTINHIGSRKDKRLFPWGVETTTVPDVQARTAFVLVKQKRGPKRRQSHI